MSSLLKVVSGRARVHSHSSVIRPPSRFTVPSSHAGGNTRQAVDSTWSIVRCSVRGRTIPAQPVAANDRTNGFVHLSAFSSACTGNGCDLRMIQDNIHNRVVQSANSWCSRRRLGVFLGTVRRESSVSAQSQGLWPWMRWERAKRRARRGKSWRGIDREWPAEAWRIDTCLHTIKFKRLQSLETTSKKCHGDDSSHSVLSGISLVRDMRTEPITGRRDQREKPDGFTPSRRLRTSQKAQPWLINEDPSWTCEGCPMPRHPAKYVSLTMAWIYR